MNSRRPRPNLNCITDKNYWKSPQTEEISSPVKVNPKKNHPKTVQCDAPDQGGGKPDIGKVKERRGRRSLCISEVLGYKTNYSTGNRKRSKNDAKNVKNKVKNTQFVDKVVLRSKSAKKVMLVDMKKGSFSDKHTISKEKIKKAIIKNAFKVSNADESPLNAKENPFNLASEGNDFIHNVRGNELNARISEQINESIENIQAWKKYMRDLGKIPDL